MASEREEAIAAGLHVGRCNYCQDDVWRDRDPRFIELGYGQLFHRGCAEVLRDLLEDGME